VRKLSRLREIGGTSLLPRGAAFGVALLLHVVVLSGFMAKLPVGLPVQWHADAHPSDAQAPMIATILWQGTQGSKAVDSTSPTLDAKHLASTPRPVDIPTPQAEGDVPGSNIQPTPAIGRTGLSCEVHIHQSPAGQVRAIDFGECTGDRVWQHALLQSIERAAQLMKPTPDARFPPVRTLAIHTSNVSPILLARQLSSTGMFAEQSMPSSREPSHL
jgi:hypothetical protein